VRHRRRTHRKLPPFVALGRQMLKSKEWRTLSPNAMIVYIYIKYKFVMSSSTIARAFKELRDAGWLEAAKHGGLFRYVNKYKITGKYDEAIINFNF